MTRPLLLSACIATLMLAPPALAQPPERVLLELELPLVPEVGNVGAGPAEFVGAVVNRKGRCRR